MFLTGSNEVAGNAMPKSYLTSAVFRSAADTVRRQSAIIGRLCAVHTGAFTFGRADPLKLSNAGRIRAKQQIVRQTNAITNA